MPTFDMPTSYASGKARQRRTRAEANSFAYVLSSWPTYW